ncbi:hypothetical protein CKM354_001076900 [Cercospora kikuchii]|uniref:Uncharacterized protein n=1 Tax=Cercospora kikuchii TaxID=84275 RepID=A0A9P3FKS4_9PEZI|nr:uncharacterized protein CKM354_001076900 [Cercospora kikuchii]GIZ47684.1 hypothetical protein CKM354_001076900 [Cercospora kikuchii]
MQHVMLLSRKLSLRPVAVAHGAIRLLWPRRYASANASTGHRRGYREAPPAISADEPTIISKDGTRTLRTRKNGSKALPIPEILDPLYLKARHKYRQPKDGHTAQTSGTYEPRSVTPFQQELALNPYARALETPIRQCALTRARLPSDLLLPFGLFMPRQGSSESGPTKPYFRPLKGYGYRTVPPPGLIGHASWVLAKNSVLQSLGARKGRGKGGGSWVRLADQRTRDDYATLTNKSGGGNVKAVAEWQWDAQMPEKVMEILRGAVLSGLKYAHPHGLVKRLDEVETKDASAVVRFKGTELKGGTVNGSAENLTADEWTGIPKFDLTKLCEESERDHLIYRLGIEDDVMVIVKDLKSLKAVLALEKIQNYVEN